MKTATKQDMPRIAAKIFPLIQPYLDAKVKAQSWREQMDKWDSEELARTEYRVKDEWATLEGGRVTKPSMVYLMREDQFDEFCKLRDAYIRSLNVPGIDEGYCPALVAEYDATECENAIVDAAEEFFGVSRLQVLCAGIEEYYKYVTLLVAMVQAYERSK